MSMSFKVWVMSKSLKSLHDGDVSSTHGQICGHELIKDKVRATNTTGVTAGETSQRV